MGHGVINVRKREENRLTNSFSMMAALMIATERTWRERERETIVLKAN